MKNFFSSILLLAIVVVGVVSCSKSESESPNQFSIYATIDALTQTKISFTDNSSEGIELEWEKGNLFSLYDNAGYLVGNFKCSDPKSGKFLAQGDIELTDGAGYTAFYPASTEQTLDSARAAVKLSEQNGDAIDQLNTSCMMEGYFTYSEDQKSSFSFKHIMAIMTFKFKSDQRPAKLLFENGDEQYSVVYNSIEPQGDIYTSYIMIKPYDATSRTLRFSLYKAGEAEPYDVRCVETNKAYEVGCMYTTSVSDIAPAMWLGSGTEKSPYLISSPEDMLTLSQNVADGSSYSGTYFRMEDDIDLINTQFCSIGSRDWHDSEDQTEGSPFSGNFDGNGKTVYNLNVVSELTDVQGLFAYIKGATIKNLTVVGSIKGKYHAGGVVGYSYESTITNCCNKVEIDIDRDVHTGGLNVSVGGVAGYIFESTISECSSQAAVSATRVNFMGGIVGWNSSSKTLRCYNLGKVSGNISENIGGIVGGTFHFCEITDCYNRGEVIGTSSVYVGGIAGSNDFMTTILNCYSASAVCAADSGACGGLVGMNNAIVKNCYYADAYHSGDAFGSEGSESECEDVEKLYDDVMARKTFVTMLNGSEEPGTWSQCMGVWNDFYPVLTWQL